VVATVLYYFYSVAGAIESQLPLVVTGVINKKAVSTSADIEE